MAQSFIAKLGPTLLLFAAGAGNAGCGGSEGAEGERAGTGAAGGGATTGGTGSGVGGTAGTSGTGTGGYGYCADRTPELVEGSGAPVAPATPLAEISVEGSECGAVEREFAEEPPLHVADCTEIAYSTNPPCTGEHYGIWPQFRVYEEPVPRGFWVHALEHGAVVIGYSCEDCDDDVAAARVLLDEIGDDPSCVAGGRPSRRTLLIPDPRLESPWAAASWGFTLTADCFEPEVFRAFVEAHRGQGPEAVCSDGYDVAADG